MSTAAFTEQPPGSCLETDEGVEPSGATIYRPSEAARARTPEWAASRAIETEAALGISSFREQQFASFSLPFS